MKNNFGGIADDTTCWVYVLAPEHNNRAYSIGYTLAHPDEFLLEHGDGRVVWIRGFRGLAEGISYKLLLESMEFGTLDYMIKSSLPESRNGK